MSCRSCGFPNRDGANFCKRCGVLLVDACPRCGAGLPEGAHFCDHCGLRLFDSGDSSWWSLGSAETRHPSEASAPRRPSEPRPAGPAPGASPGHAVEPATGPSRALRPAAPRTPAEPGRSGAESGLQQYIPKELKAKLDAARVGGQTVGERKQVTVLFTDIVGSTALAEKLDPEDWSEIVSGAHRRVSEAVYRYEGTIAQLLGDGVLAFFGAPIAHEDDPVRAVNAALDILKHIQQYRDELKAAGRLPDFQMRIGLNTGLVVVGNIGSDLHMEYLAIGDAINLAARMEQTALPGTVQVAQETYKHVRAIFECEDLGGVAVKGKSEPVPAHRVLSRKEHAGRTRGIEGLHAEMVGREAELLTLRGVVTDLRHGVGRIVFVLGEAGLGKTRLVSEARKVFEELVGPDGRWYETTSLSYETHQAYGLFQRLIRQVGGIGYDDGPDVMREKLAVVVEPVPEERRSRATQLFHALFGLESQDGGPAQDGETFKRELAEAMGDWWRAHLARRPTVLVFDDMHWSDGASIELLTHLLPLTGEAPLLLVCALRSERHAPAWKIKAAGDEEYHHLYTEVSLRPLSESESNELVNRLLAIAELPPGLRASILEKSAGNPFFLEEVVRTLIDRGVVVPEDRTVDSVTRRYWRATSDGATFDIPDNLQSLLAARMDRLEEAARATLQVASVIGRSFYHRVLKAVDEAGQDLDKQLATLTRLDMIRESARVPEIEYAFRNPLTHEAVYKTILLKRRRAFHGRVGVAMETLFPDRSSGLYGLLAHHFSLAGELGKAIEYSRQAAQQAVAVYAYDDAIRNLRAAIELIEADELGPVHREVLEELGDVYRLVRDFVPAIESYRQALKRWRALGDAEKIVEIRLHRKIVQVATEAKWSVDAAAYRRVAEMRAESRATLGESAQTLADESPHPETVRLLVALSVDAWRIETPPDWDAAQGFAESAVEMAERLGDRVVLAQALGALASVLDGRSLLREHLDVTQRQLTIAREPGFADERERTEALRSAGAALMYVGEYERALPLLREAEALAVRGQVIDQQASALGLQTQCWFRLDRWDEMLATEDRWRDLERHYSRERVGET